MITPTDEAKLTWYFGHGQTAFERSTIGPMLAHAELYGHAGQLAWSGREDGYAVDACRIRRPSSAWASVEHGEIISTGYAITARPTAELRQASGYVPDSRAMELFAEVSSVLRGLEWRAVAVLRAYYGDLGTERARNPKPGRIGALYHLTKAGMRHLLQAADEASRKGQPFAVMSPERQMANEIAAKRTEPRRIAFMHADRQAWALLALAWHGWRVAGSQVQRGRGRARRAA
jgi:hypothetical protein